jgi:GNAT superfamily N-acetyltransferase
MGVTIVGPVADAGARAKAILRQLPDWFGIPAAIERYTQEIPALPTWLALDGEYAIGFLTVKQHTSVASELYVLGLLPRYHRHGIGRRLLACAEEALRDDGIRLLQVKTLGPSHSSAAYRRTRAFYTAMGFLPLEESFELWGADNPCLILVKCL